MTLSSTRELRHMLVFNGQIIIKVRAVNERVKNERARDIPCQMTTVQTPAV